MRGMKIGRPQAPLAGTDTFEYHTGHGVETTLGQARYQYDRRIAGLRRSSDPGHATCRPHHIRRWGGGSPRCRHFLRGGKTVVPVGGESGGGVLFRHFGNERGRWVATFLPFNLNPRALPQAVPLSRGTGESSSQGDSAKPMPTFLDAPQSSRRFVGSALSPCFVANAP